MSNFFFPGKIKEYIKMMKLLPSMLKVNAYARWPRPESVDLAAYRLDTEVCILIRMHSYALSSFLTTSQPVWVI